MKSEIQQAIEFGRTRLSTGMRQIDYPGKPTHGKFHLVGHIPAACTEFRNGRQASKIYDTEADAAAALIAAGVTRFQLADCSWNTDAK